MLNALAWALTGWWGLGSGSSIPLGGSFQTDLEKPLPPVLANAAQISQLVMNLVMNAFEAIVESRLGQSTRRVTMGPDSPVADGVGAGQYPLTIWWV